jgi:ABC-2 type transporter
MVSGATLPRAWQLGLARGGVEVKAFFRDKMAVAFVFGLPPILLVPLGSIFGSQAAAQGVLLGIAASSVPRSAASAMPVITLPFTVLQFISGVYVPFTVVPAWMRDVASFFPLKWMAQGMRSVFLPEHHGYRTSPEPVTAATTRAVSVRSGRTTCAPAAVRSAAG